MRSLSKWGFFISCIGLCISLISLWETCSNKIYLEKRIANLEVKNLEGLFRLENPVEHSILPAREEIKLTGTYIRSIPEGYKPIAILQNASLYYVIRNQVSLDTDRKWSLMIRPWPDDEWKVIICLADKDGAKEIVSWSSEVKQNGEINWDNPRAELPSGIVKNSMFIFSAK